MDFHHVPILLEECMEALRIHPSGIYVDGTLGGAGHSRELAAHLDANGTLIGIDKDKEALAAARERLAAAACTVHLTQGDFGDIPLILDKLEIAQVDGILLDLGVSSHQLDTPERGFSYHNDAPLDMRMGDSGQSAYDVLATYSEQDLTRIFRLYGEERYARKIAGNIVRHREEYHPLKTTGELVDVIKASIPAAARREGGHPAKRVFQAVRIEVNGELDSLERCLETAFDCLKPGGRFAVITFHSLEDRMVKRAFAGYAAGCDCPADFPICVCGKEPRAKLIARKPVIPSAKELAENNRSRSAKLRVLEKV